MVGCWRRMEGVGGWKVLRRMKVVGGSGRESTQKEGELLYIPKAEWMEWPGPPSPPDAVWSNGTGSRAKGRRSSLLDNPYCLDKSPSVSSLPIPIHLSNTNKADPPKLLT